MSQAVTETSKQCYVCKLPKPLGWFAKDSRTKDGRRRECKTCQAEYRSRPETKELTREWHQKNRKRTTALSAAWRRKNRLKANAQSQVYKAIRRGDLVRPSKCSKCGGGNFIEASHDDYSKPLQVEWLCALCHRRKDSARPRQEEVAT